MLPLAHRIPCIDLANYEQAARGVVITLIRACVQAKTGCQQTQSNEAHPVFRPDDGCGSRQIALG